jgi:O-methyltransferase
MFDKLKEVWRETSDFRHIDAEFREVWTDAARRNELLKTFRAITSSIQCPHNESHTLTFVVEMLRFCQEHPSTDGVFVEAGCFKGGSSAKFSHVAKVLDRKLLIFDSFEGMPENEESHDKSIFGYSIKNWFGKGEFCGRLDEVRNNIEIHGVTDVCELHQGWFENTLPDFGQAVLGAYIDVDLASSTKTCVKYLYPRLVDNGFLVSQDGDFPLVIEVLDDNRFWEEEVGCPKPRMKGLGTSKMIRIYKDA